VWKPKRILEFEALLIHYKQQGDDFIQRYRSLSRIERGNLFRDEKANIQRVLSSMSQEEREVLVWQHYERWRYFSCQFDNLNRPYLYVCYLAEQGVVDSIITTNYDLFIHVGLSKRTVSHIQNPCLPENHWHCSGYYSYVQEHGLHLWKIHGDFGFFKFRGCRCIHRLPSDEIVEKPYRHHYGTTRQINLSKHYHDYNFVRKRYFLNEIEAAISELQNLEQVGLISVMGFAGYYDEKTKSGEELAPVFVSIARQNPNIPVFMVISRPDEEYQYQTWLWNKLTDINPHYTIRTVSPQDPIDTVLYDIFSQVPMLPHICQWVEVEYQKIETRRRLMGGMS